MLTDTVGVLSEHRESGSTAIVTQDHRQLLSPDEQEVLAAAGLHGVGLLDLGGEGIGFHAQAISSLTIALPIPLLAECTTPHAFFIAPGSWSPRPPDRGREDLTRRIRRIAHRRRRRGTRRRELTPSNVIGSPYGRAMTTDPAVAAAEPMSGADGVQVAAVPIALLASILELVLSIIDRKTQLSIARRGREQSRLALELEFALRLSANRNMGGSTGRVETKRLGAESMALVGGVGERRVPRQYRHNMDGLNVAELEAEIDAMTKRHVRVGAVAQRSDGGA